MILTQGGKEIVAIYKQDGNEVDEVKDANGRLVYTNTREITGTLPLSFTSRGKPLADYRISGNAVQDGTPTPEAPVDVVGCGVSTRNLVEFSNGTTTVLAVDVNVEKQKVTFSGTSSGSGGRLVRISNYIALDPGVYILSILGSGACPSPVLQNYSNSSEFYSVGRAFTLESKKIFFISFNFAANREYNGTLSIMLNLGSTALPYEPYGYKLPLTVNGTESPIYLGEVPTTRRIKKLVLTGEETIDRESAYDRFSFYIVDMRGYGVRLTQLYCTHYQNISDGRPVRDIPNNSIYAGGGSDSKKVFIKTTDYTTAEDFKSYLAAQYAAGTPVTVWYVLATPVAGIVNEPLMKIGDYADTVSMAQAGVTIPTISGANVLDMTSPVKPSEVYIKGKGIKAIT